MVVLVDTNVIIDYLMTREPFYRASAEVIKKCANKEITGYIAFHSIPNLWYILRKVPEDKRREWIMDVCSFLRVAGASHEEVVRAINMKDFADFEDCLQDECARMVNADCLVTCNLKDFKEAKTKIYSPDEFVALLEY